MLTVALVLRSGGDYGPVDVRRLVRQLWGRLIGHVEHRIVCLSDMPVPGVDVVPLAHGWPGWWSKLELFRPGVFPNGDRIFYIDLDTILLGPIDSILSIDQRFVVLEDFYHPPKYGSGLMMWTAGDAMLRDLVWTPFAADPERAMEVSGWWGDQAWLWRTVPLDAVSYFQRERPGEVVSFKVHCRDGRPPEGARVVCFHGRPKPADLAELDWVRGTL